MKNAITLAIAAITLAACGASPAPEFIGATRTDVTVNGRDYSVFQKGERVEVIRLGYAKRGDHQDIRATMIELIPQVTGCKLREVVLDRRQRRNARVPWTAPLDLPAGKAKKQAPKRGPAMRPIDLSRTLPHARIAELPNPYFGKVRDCYDLPDGTRLLISSDRISAFDQILAVIPWKGQVLTQLARYWFDKTGDIAANHVIGYPDPNTVHCKRVTILPVEIVVRGYLAGTTSTSILTAILARACAQMYGHRLPDGLRDNQALPQAIITPTSKAFDGGHDEPLTAAEIVDTGLLTKSQWDEVSEKALALFAQGSGNGRRPRADPGRHEV